MRLKRGAYWYLRRSKRILIILQLIRPNGRQFLFDSFDWRRVWWSTFLTLGRLKKIKNKLFASNQINSSNDFTFASINLASSRSVADLRFSLVSAWAPDSFFSFPRYSSSCSIIFSSAMADWVRKLLSWLRKSLFWFSTPTACDQLSM